MYVKKPFLVFIMLFVFLFLCIQNGFSQQLHYRASVQNCKTAETVSFAHVFSSDSSLLGITDIDGRFMLEMDKADSIRFSALGYQSLVVWAEKGTQHNLCLEEAALQLSEVVVEAGENPALRILKQLAKHASLHYHKNLDSYSYTTYDRFVAGFDTVSLQQAELLELARKQELMVMETVSEKYFMAPDKQHEKVIASQISGFNDPLLFFLMSQWQATDFYAPSLQIAGQYYANPINSRSLSKYSYVLESAIPDQNGDTIFHIRFFPQQGNLFDGLTGEMKINGTDWAIRTVSAETEKNEQGLSCRIRQLYDKVDDHWFPVQLQTYLLFQNPMMPAMSINGYGNSYLSDIQINKALDKKIFRAGEIQVKQDIPKHDSLFWNAVRVDSLPLRLRQTYHFMDSLGEKAGTDRMLNASLALLHAKLPLGFIDLAIDELLLFTDYEGFKPTIAINTNHRFSNTFKLSAASGFATRVSRWTYRLGMLLYLDKNNKATIDFHYVNDFFASGGSSLPEEQAGWLYSNSYRHFFVNRMNRYKGWEAGLFWQPHHRWQLGLRTADMHVFVGDEPYFLPHLSASEKTIDLKELGFRIRYAVGERAYYRHREKLLLDNAKMVVTAGFIHGFLDNQFDETYQKLELRGEKIWKTNYLGNTSLRLEAAQSWGELPYPLMFNIPASYRSFSVEAPNSFGSMRMNEFIADRHMMLFARHDFGSLLFKKGKFAPHLGLATHIAFGSLRPKHALQFPSLKTPEKGYFESGVILGNLLSNPLMNLGVGVFYRYGHYQLDKTLDNFSLKLVVRTAFN